MILFTYSTAATICMLISAQLVAAKKAGRKIAVEIKGFESQSEMSELEKAVGQLTICRLVLAKRLPEFILYLAVPQEVIKDIFEEPLGKLLIEDGLNRIIGFDPMKEEIVQWIS